ncbi:MAG: CRISPR-associated helicase/endonuclease Cas3 [Candidatus Helarchaeota archaeon]
MEHIWEYKNLPNITHYENLQIEDFTITGPDAKWLISSWRSQFIVTTFVKLFNTLLKPFKKNILKFHRLAHSVIIIDEIQCLPIEYWELCKHILESTQKILNCTIFISTATLPKIITPTSNNFLAKDHLDLKIQFGTKTGNIHEFLDRYNILFYKKPLIIDDFCSKLCGYLNNHPNDDVLIVLNTLDTLSRCYKYLEEEKQKNVLKNTEFYILSTLVLPIDRQNSINEIKSFIENKISHNSNSNKRLVALSTQLIEAGVDLSFKIIIRDLAPLDSIIQVAGRCNRNMEYFPEKGTIHVLHLKRTNSSISDVKLIYRNINNLITVIHDLFSALSKNRSLSTEFGDALIVNEKILRKNLEIYYSDIYNKTSMSQLIDKLTNLKFKDLAYDFKLIKNDYNKYYLLPLTQYGKEIHKFIQNSNKIPKNFYLHVILISEKQKEILLNHYHITQYNQKSDNSLLYYVIDLNIFQKIYYPRLGLIL